MNINVHIDININIDIHIIIHMDIGDYMKYYLLNIALLVPYWYPIDALLMPY